MLSVSRPVPECGRESLDPMGKTGMMPASTYVTMKSQTPLGKEEKR